MKTDFQYNNTSISLNHHDDHMGWILRYTNSFYELKLLQFIQEHQKKRGLFIDVGANIGNHTVFFSKFCADKVISIEPVKENFDLLKLNIEENDLQNITLYNAPISNKRAKYIYKTVKINMGLCNMEESEQGVDALLAEDLTIENLTLIKIDCEAMSMAVFESFKFLILKFIPDLVIEATKEELAYILKQIPYKIVGRFNSTPTYYLSPI